MSSDKNIDLPRNFGYNRSWIVVKGNNKVKISEILEIKEIHESNWEHAFYNMFKGYSFISPKAGDWTFALNSKYGAFPPKHENCESIRKLETILNKLSSEFGESYYFSNHEIVDHYSWIRSVNGNIERLYSYLGFPENKHIINYGEPDESEVEIVNQNGSIDKNLVIKIASLWTINPLLMSNRIDVKTELGLLGIRSKNT